MRRVFLPVAAAALLLAGSMDARADTVVLPLFQPLEAPAPSVGLPTAPLQLRPFGPASPARFILFPAIRTIRPTDIPPPKATKGLGVVFDW